jgi:hypothetical protein
LDALLRPLSAVALAVGCLWVYWRQWRGTMSVERAFLACICVVIATNKVFSPQYLIWVLPFVALVEELDVVWVVVCLLTTLIYPIYYQHFAPLATTLVVRPKAQLVFLGTVALRNGVLLVATVRVLLGREQAKYEPTANLPPLLPRFPRELPDQAAVQVTSVVND